MCLYPKLVTNPKYKSNKKNGGIIPPIQDNRILLVPIGCGNCIECRKKKAREWQVRLLEEIKKSPNAYFITLTFSDESIYRLSQEKKTTGYTLDNQIATLAMRRFLERWRKTYKKSLRHWTITELGHKGTNNIHLHGIIWLENRQQILTLQKHWLYGHTWQGNPKIENNKIIDYINYVNEQTIGYIIKYVTKIEERYKNYKPKILTSPGIGQKYTKTFNASLNKYNGEETKDNYTTSTGHTIALPIYYRNKIYNDQERENLWIKKLNEQKRYVLGQEIDTSENENIYIIVRNAAREKNRQLGYGTAYINYNEKEYEQKLRIQMQQTRIERALARKFNKDVQEVLKNGTPF